MNRRFVIPPRLRRTLRLFLLRLGLSLGAVLFTLLGIELLVRWVPLYPADLSSFDPAIGPVFVPGASGVKLNPGCWLDYRQTMTINSQGLRDSEHPYERGDPFRVLLLGDSFVEAQQVPLDATFHAQLETLLGIEVIAAGHGGWGTDNELLWYRNEGYKYNPDLVLLLYQPGNDVQDNSTTINYVPNQTPYFTLEADGLMLHTDPPGDSVLTADRGPFAGSVHELLLDYSYLYGLYMMRARRIQLVRGIPQSSESGGDSKGAGEPQPSFDDLYDQAFELTLALVDQLRREAKANGSQFAVAIASTDRQLLFGGDSSREAAALTELGIPFVDLLPTIRAAHSETSPMHFACDGHWTAAGHKVVAEILAEFLQTQGWMKK